MRITDDSVPSHFVGQVRIVAETCHPAAIRHLEMDLMRKSALMVVSVGVPSRSGCLTQAVMAHYARENGPGDGL